jgi:hypothetical protein
LVSVITVFLVILAVILAFAQTGIRELAGFVRSLFLLSRACLCEKRVIGILGRGVMRRRILRRVFSAAFWSIPSYVRGDYRQAGRRLGPLVRHIETQLAALSAKQKSELIEAADTIEIMAGVFSHQMRCHLMGGALDEAMQTLVRARGVLGVERLAAFPEIDYKAAQLVKAGLAAGRLIDGSGISAILMNPPDGRGLGTTTSPRRSRPRRIGDLSRLTQRDEKRGVLIQMRRPAPEDRLP